MSENNDMIKRMEAYKSLLEEAVELRKKTVSVPELSNKLDMQQSAIYRFERCNRDPHLTTMIAYLHAFGYKLQIVPDKLEIVSKEEEAIKVTKALTKRDRRRRLMLMRYLVEIETAILNNEADDEDETGGIK